MALLEGMRDEEHNPKGREKGKEIGKARDKVAAERHGCHCGKSFLRKEHLRRHQATHGERSHVCHVCQRSFTRT